MTTTDAEAEVTPRATKRVAWRRILVGWFAVPMSAFAALVIGAVLILAFGANPAYRLPRPVVGRIRRDLRPRQYGAKGGPAPARGRGDMHSRSGERLEHRWRRPDRNGGARIHGHRLGCRGPAAWVLLPLVLVAAAAGGAIWAGIAGFFKAYFNVNEILSTIMLNLVAVQVMNYLLSGPRSTSPSPSR